ncbi:MAG: prolipoprotein diacylglyceryl transferase [Proteobacteria bacterium]|nr:prolipoprotein diacylglyceryl transferase [Pseudomonadota bacterium]
MKDGLVHNLSPLLINTEVLHLTYYDFFFGATIGGGALLWWWQMRRGGYSRKTVVTSIPWMIIALMLGIRLVHCIFYQTELLSEAPIEVLILWRGGYSSHGGFLGMALFFLIWSRIHRVSFIDIFDRFAFSGAASVILVRLGNFFNSEIVGRETSLPWGVRFMRFDNGQVARHPSQLYEVALGIFVFMVLLAADRRTGKEKRPRGLLLGLVVTLYFTGRFFVEFSKEYQTLDPAAASLTMGQYLSFAPIVFGVVVLIWSAKKSTPHK